MPPHYFLIFHSSPEEEYFCKEAICAEQQWGFEVVQCFSAPCREMKWWNVLWMFSPSCLSWNIFIPNKPVFTLEVAWGCHSFPDTLLKVQLNSLIINKLICKVFPEVYHSFDGNVTCPILRGGVENANICSNYLDEGSWGKGAAATLAYILHRQTAALQREDQIV